MRKELKIVHLQPNIAGELTRNSEGFLMLYEENGKYVIWLSILHPTNFLLAKDSKKEFDSLAMADLAFKRTMQKLPIIEESYQERSKGV